MTYRFQAEIKAEHLRALAHLAAQQDIRTYLNGVQVIATPEVLLVATTGTVVGALRTRQTASTRFEVRVPNETLKALGKFKGVVLIGSDDGVDWVLKAGPATLNWEAPDEVYPDWQRAIPASVSGAPFVFDARLLALFWKVAKDLDADGAGGHSVLLAQNGPDTGLVSLPAAPDFIGAQAPLRESDKLPKPAKTAPSWAKEPSGIPVGWRTAQACDLA